jgi:hypothetical protein
MKIRVLHSLYRLRKENTSYSIFLTRHLWPAVELTIVLVLRPFLAGSRWVTHYFRCHPAQFLRSHVVLPLPWHVNPSIAHHFIGARILLEVTSLPLDFSPLWISTQIPPPTSVATWVIRSGICHLVRQTSCSKVAMVNLGCRSTTESEIPLWMPSLPARTTMPSHRGARNRPQQFIMPYLVGKGRHGEEGGVHLHRWRVVPPSGFNCQPP